MAGKRVCCPLIERCDQILNCRVRAHASQRHSTKHIQYIEHVHVPPPCHETPHNPLQPIIGAIDGASAGIKAFLGAHGVLLDHISDGKKRREGVSKLEDADSRDERGEAREIRYARGDDKGNGPVDGDHGDPEVFSHFGGQRRCAEYLDENVVIEHFGSTLEDNIKQRSMSRKNTFDSNVAIECGCDQCADHCKHVARGLEAVFGNTEIAWIDHILALIAVHEETIKHVDEIDEKLRKPHALHQGVSKYLSMIEDHNAHFQKVSRTLHFGHEFREDHRSSI